MLKVSSPGSSTIVVGGEPSPQSSEMVLVSVPPGLMSVPPTVTVSPSPISDEESTRPGGANCGAGSLMATVVCANALLAPSLSVTPIAYWDSALLV